MIGRILGGRYRIDARIGQGGFGTVYRGAHLRLGDTVAIKTISAPHPGMVDRFHREAKLQRRLRHPAFVRLLDFDIAPDGLHYMVQEFVDGRTLKAVLNTEGPLDPARLAALTVQLLQALEEAHEVGIVHRDLKPANIMLTDGLRGEEVRLLDFGIAKLFDDEESSALLTQPHQIIGTVYYMAPEQITCQPVGPTTDLYQLGCVLYEACASVRPFTGGTQAVLRKQMMADPPPLPDAVPEELSTIILRAMQKAPSDRFPSSHQMRIALLESGLVTSEAIMWLPSTGEVPALATTAVDDAPTTEQSRPPMPGPTRPTRSKKWAMLLAALALAGVIGWGLWPADAPHQARSLAAVSDLETAIPAAHAPSPADAQLDAEPTTRDMAADTAIAGGGPSLDGAPTVADATPDVEPRALDVSSRAAPEPTGRTPTRRWRAPTRPRPRRAVGRRSAKGPPDASIAPEDAAIPW